MKHIAVIVVSIIFIILLGAVVIASTQTKKVHVQELATCEADLKIANKVASQALDRADSVIRCLEFQGEVINILLKEVEIAKIKGVQPNRDSLTKASYLMKEVRKILDVQKRVK